MTNQDTPCHTPPMTDAIKSRQVRLYLDRQAQSDLDEVASHIPDLSESEIMSLVVRSGLREIRRNGSTFCLPLQFQMVNPSTGKAFDPS